MMSVPLLLLLAYILIEMRSLVSPGIPRDLESAGHGDLKKCWLFTCITYHLGHRAEHSAWQPGCARGGNAKALQPSACVKRLVSIIHCFAASLLPLDLLGCRDERPAQRQPRHLPCYSSHRPLQRCHPAQLQYPAIFSPAAVTSLNCSYPSRTPRRHLRHRTTARQITYRLL